MAIPNSTVLGMLNEIVSNEKKNDPFRNNLLEIHIGLIHASLVSDFEQAKSLPLGMKYLCTFNGINIFVNFNIKDTSYIPIYKDRPYKDQLPGKIIEIQGFKPSKSWLKRYRIQ